MNWQEERYVRVYTRDTPDWVALDWQSRAVFTEILRKCDRRGTIELGRSGACGLAQLVRIPQDVVERALAQLVEDGCVRQSGTTLSVRNFVAAQEACATEARRAREYRERLRERLEQLALPIDGGSSREEMADSDVGHDPSRHSDASDRASQAVTLNCAVPSHAEPRRDPHVSTRSRERSRAMPLPEDWQPSEATIARFRHERVDALGSLEKFRSFFGSVGARRTNWDKAFTKWVLDDIERGRHKLWSTPESSRSIAPPTPALDALSPEEAKQHFERLHEELRGGGTIPWDGSA